MTDNLRRHQVFVSSPLLDLKEARREAFFALLAQECVPIGMEFFGAYPESSWQLIRRLIDESDYYVLLVGNRYGSIAPGTDLGYTEREYRFSQEPHREIKCVVFFVDVPPLPDPEPPEHQIKLKAFKEMLWARHQVIPTDLSGLGAAVSRGIDHLRQWHPEPGWVKEKTYFAQTISNEGQYRDALAQRLRDAQDRVVFSFPPKEGQTWVFDLLPAILTALKKNVGIEVRYHSRPDEKESGAFELLKGLGCEIVPVPEPPRPGDQFSGLIVDSENSAVSRLVCATPKEKWRPGIPWAAALRGEHMAPLARTADKNFPSATQMPASALLTRMHDAVLRSRLRRVNDYKNERISIHVEKVRVGCTLPMSKEVLRVKNSQVPLLNDLYFDAGLELYEPAMVALSQNRWTFLVPPVLEEQSDGTYRVIEGHTRLFHQVRTAGLDAEVWAVVVRKVTPPGVPIHLWSDVQFADDRHPNDDDYVHSHNLETKTHATYDRESGKYKLDFITELEIERAIAGDKRA